MLEERYFDAWLNQDHDSNVREIKAHEYYEYARRRRGHRQIQICLSGITLNITYHWHMTEGDATRAVGEYLFNELPHPDQPAYRGVEGGQDGPPAVQLPLFPPAGQGGR